MRHAQRLMLAHLKKHNTKQDKNVTDVLCWIPRDVKLSRPLTPDRIAQATQTDTPRCRTLGSIAAKC